MHLSLARWDLDTAKLAPSGEGRSLSWEGGVGAPHAHCFPDDSKPVCGGSHGSWATAPEVSDSEEGFHGRSQASQEKSL